MTTHAKRALVAVLAATAASCAPSAETVSEADRRAMEAEVTQWAQTYWAAFADGASGFDRGIAFFEDTPDFILASDGEIWTSLAAADAAFRPAFQTIDHQTFDIPETHVAVLGPDEVEVGARGTYVQTGVDGRTVGPTQVAVTMRLVRTDGAWRIRSYHQSEPNASASPLEGTFEYVGSQVGQSILTGGHWVFLYGPADGSRPMTSEAGTYTIAGDTVTNAIRYSANPARIGTTFRWTAESMAGDTMSYAVIGDDGQVTGRGRSVRIR